MEQNEIHSVIGDEGFGRLVAAFYRRIPEDEILGPMYEPHDLQGAEQRLRDFLIYRFGGSHQYLEERGHPRLGMRHVRFPIGPAARNRWVELMTAALHEAGFPSDVEKVLLPFFETTASFLINRPVDADAAG